MVEHPLSKRKVGSSILPGGSSVAPLCSPNTPFCRPTDFWHFALSRSHLLLSRRGFEPLRPPIASALDRPSSLGPWLSPACFSLALPVWYLLTRTPTIRHSEDHRPRPQIETTDQTQDTTQPSVSWLWCRLQKDKKTREPELELRAGTPRTARSARPLQCLIDQYGDLNPVRRAESTALVFAASGSTTTSVEAVGASFGRGEAARVVLRWWGGVGGGLVVRWCRLAMVGRSREVALSEPL